MSKSCKQFVNANCCFNCPNHEIDFFEYWYGIPASDAGLERISCKECQYRDDLCTCMDCYNLGGEECPLRGFV